MWQTVGSALSAATGSSVFSEEAALDSSLSASAGPSEPPLLPPPLPPAMPTGTSEQQTAPPPSEQQTAQDPPEEDQRSSSNEDLGDEFEGIPQDAELEAWMSRAAEHDRAREEFEQLDLAAAGHGVAPDATTRLQDELTALFGSFDPAGTGRIDVVSFKQIFAVLIKRMGLKLCWDDVERLCAEAVGVEGAESAADGGGLRGIEDQGLRSGVAIRDGAVAGVGTVVAVAGGVVQPGHSVDARAAGAGEDKGQYGEGNVLGGESAGKEQDDGERRKEWIDYEAFVKAIMQRRDTPEEALESTPDRWPLDGAPVGKK